MFTKNIYLNDVVIHLQIIFQGEGGIINITHCDRPENNDLESAYETEFDGINS